MLPLLRYLPTTKLLATMRDMALLAALRAAIAVLALIGKDLKLTENERRAVLARIEASLLVGAEATPSP